MRTMRLISLVLFAFFANAGALADPARWAAEGWTTDFTKASIRWDEILEGGPPRDGIPPIDQPVFVAVGEENDLPANEPVIALEIGGDARAYPLRILTWHEIVNDTVGGVPVAVTYCPLCNASVVFERTLDGKSLDFGTSGKLRNSDLVMYDRQTQSWWQQFTGEAIAGSLTGKALNMLPSTVMGFGKFKTRWPQAKILVPNDANLRQYGRNPYIGYDTASAPFLYNGNLPQNVPAMAHVVVVRNGNKPVIVTLEAVRKSGSLDAGGFRLEWADGVSSALDQARISEGRDIGGVTVTRDGKPVVHDVTFAFVAHAFHPEIPIRTQ